MLKPGGEVYPNATVHWRSEDHTNWRRLPGGGRISGGFQEIRFGHRMAGCYFGPISTRRHRNSPLYELLANGVCPHSPFQCYLVRGVVPNPSAQIVGRDFLPVAETLPRARGRGNAEFNFRP